MPSSLLTDLVRTLFDGPNYAHVATVMPDGSPHTVPVWVAVEEDDRIAFLTSPGSRKARNLARDGRVAISITDRDRPFTMAAVRGRVARVEGDAAWAIIDRISHKYIGAPYEPREDRIVFLVEPEHAWAEAIG